MRDHRFSFDDADFLAYGFTTLQNLLTEMGINALTLTKKGKISPSFTDGDIDKERLTRFFEHLNTFEAKHNE